VPWLYPRVLLSRLINLENIVSREGMISILKSLQRLPRKWFVSPKEEGGLGAIDLKSKMMLC
jgi:hypothetical protein